MFVGLRAFPEDLNLLADEVASFDDVKWRTWLEYARSFVVLLGESDAPHALVRALGAVANRHREHEVRAERMIAIARDVESEQILTSVATPETAPLRAGSVWSEVVRPHRAAFATCGDQVFGSLEPGLSASRLLTIIDPYLLNVHQQHGFLALLRRALASGTSSFELACNWAEQDGKGCQRFWVPRHDTPSGALNARQCAPAHRCNTLDDVEARVRGLIYAALEEAPPPSEPEIEIRLILREWTPTLTENVHAGKDFDGHDRLLAFQTPEAGPGAPWVRVVTVGRGVVGLVSDPARSTTIVGRLPPQSYEQALRDYRSTTSTVTRCFSVDARLA